MFDLDRFVADCQTAVASPHPAKAALELMRETLKDCAAIAEATAQRAEQGRVLEAPVFRSPELTVLDVVLQPGMLSIPHDHRMWAVIGIYEGEEANTFYGRAGDGLEEANRRSVGKGEAMLLGEHVIHAIENPLKGPTRGLHVYGGDLLGQARSMWSPEGREAPYDVPQFHRWSRDLALARRAKQPAG